MHSILTILATTLIQRFFFLSEHRSREVLYKDHDREVDTASESQRQAKGTLLD